MIIKCQKCDAQLTVEVSDPNPLVAAVSETVILSSFGWRKDGELAYCPRHAAEVEELPDFREMAKHRAKYLARSRKP